MKIGLKKVSEDVAENLYEQMPEQELFLRIRDDLLYSRTGIRMDEQVTKKDPEKFLEEVNQYIDRMYHISEEKKHRFDKYIEKYIFGFHVLTEIMEAKDITDIKVLAWNNVRIKQFGRRKATGICFWSKEDFRGFVEMIAVKNGINIGSLNAIQTFTDKNSSERFIYRFNISTGAVNSTGEPYLHVRKIPKDKLTMEELMDLQMFDEQMAAYVKKRITEGYMLISGSNGSGKTNFLNVFLDEIPEEESVLVVQENEELSSKTHPDMMFQHIAVRRGEGKIHYGLKELVINGLLTDIDHIIIGEIKGGEALYFLNAFLSGCLGMATIHSINAAGALDMLVTYAKWESDYSREELSKLLTCVKTVVHMEDFQVSQIVEVRGWDAEEKQIRLHTVYDRKEGIHKL